MKRLKKLADLPITPREFVRDPVLLEFLGLLGTSCMGTNTCSPRNTD